MLVAWLLGAARRVHRRRHRPRRSRAHLVLITIDTLRADRLGAYGSTTVATPNLDRLAREGAMAVHASVHGAADAAVARLAPDRALPGRARHSRQRLAAAWRQGVPLLAEILQQRGFRDRARSSRRSCCRSSPGSAAGSTHYSDRFEIGEDDARFLNTIQKRGDATVAEAAAWLASPGRNGASRGSTSTIRTIRTSRRSHTRRATPDGPTTARWRGPTNWWAGSTRCSAPTGLRDDTLFVVTSDHGEGLDEHGEAVHGFFVYETTLHVPLIVRGPGVAPGTRLDGGHADRST